MKTICCVVVGNITVGKTRLLYTNCHNSYPEDAILTVFDDYSVKINVEGHSINLILFDTYHNEDGLNHIMYPKADVFIICFSLVNKDSFENVDNYWFHEIRSVCPNTPFLLVGTKKDLRDEYEINEDRYKTLGMSPISTEKGEEMKRRIGAREYIECSSLKQIKVKEVFEEASKIALQYKNTTEKTIDENSCCIIY